tara:strand:- start:20540 stop:21058 length:519 start_codon:yes stop_codon:yes gene_type:complete
MAGMRDFWKAQVEIERFLSLEARLLEQNRFDEWIDLFTDDVHYVMPVRESVEPAATGGAAAHSTGFALFDDDKRSLELRARRIETGLAHAEIPLSVTQRLITNVLVEDSDVAGEYMVGSNFLVYQERRGRHSHTFIGSRRDRFVMVGQKWKIDYREISLAQTVMPATISIFF